MRSLAFLSLLSLGFATEVSESCPRAGHAVVPKKMCVRHGGHVVRLLSGGESCCRVPEVCPAPLEIAARESHRWTYSDECSKRGGEPVPGWTPASMSSSERSFFLSEMVCCHVGEGGGVPLCGEVDGHEEVPEGACERLGGTVTSHAVNWGDGHKCCKRPAVCEAPAHESHEVEGRPEPGFPNFWATEADCRNRGGRKVPGWIPEGLGFESSETYLNSFVCCSAAGQEEESGSTDGIRFCHERGDKYAEVTEGICERLGGKRAGFAVRSSSALQGNICCEKSPECDTAQESKFMWTSEANCNLRKGHVIPGWPQNRAPYELTYDEFQRKLEHGVCCAEEVRK